MGQKKRLLHELPYTESENSGTIIHAYILLPMLCSLTGCYVQKSIFLCKTFICTNIFFYFLNKNAKIKRIPASGDFGFQQINLANIMSKNIILERKKSMKNMYKGRFHILSFIS